MQNYESLGRTVTIPAPADTASGAPVLVGKLFGFAVGAATSGDPLDVITEGVFTSPKVAADAFAVGDAVYYSAANGMTATADGNTEIGYAVEAAAAGAVSVSVRIR
ncbi:hypothetical protein AA0472_1387 [Acetobacter estunensis NRIC 0472]|uniref:DUF2190 family protein n=1 Tax=Acetobacter estunensis TaxID=104097 RepID=A0A967B8Q2_9PROT|nr:DUF2190 family protein [Acetobacter estunensis]NHO54221.1 DUF2190 family protein [Acetobacter estunensis]GBQ24327.1 hypothetical protein AA0472_1387 [Acetobacter estunensis NRIC 0472]